jgi:hypothetical protein
MYVIKLYNNIIEVIILNGKFKDEHVLLPRFPMTPTDKPLEFKLLQFTVRLAFSMIISKLQGQLKQVYELNFENSCFLHG